MQIADKRINGLVERSVDHGHQPVQSLVATPNNDDEPLALEIYNQCLFIHAADEQFSSNGSGRCKPLPNDRRPSKLHRLLARIRDFYRAEYLDLVKQRLHKAR